jgi:hypothetical protein
MARMGNEEKPKVSDNFQPCHLTEKFFPGLLTVAPKIQLEHRLQVGCQVRRFLLVIKNFQNRCFEVGIS